MKPAGLRLPAKPGCLYISQRQQSELRQLFSHLLGRLRLPPLLAESGFVPCQEPFMLRQHSDEEVGDYDDGFKAGFKGRPNDDGKSQAGERAQE
jgi:hypothetical protein